MNNLSLGIWTAIIADIFIFMLTIYWAYKTDLIKDGVGGATLTKPYSMSRTQFLWWIMIVTISFIFMFAYNGTFPILNTTSLVLLGISAGTTVSGRIIDNNQAQKADNATPSLPPVKDNFIYDILSDENGVSVHRFQALIFNVVLGLFFLVKCFTEFKLPEFGAQELALLGISSSTYLAGKLNENMNVPLLPPTN